MSKVKETVDRLIDREILTLANELDETLYELDVDLHYEAWRNRPLETEVLQVFIVSRWLARKLDEIGEPVALDFHGLYWWGRTCCGQTIEADGTMQKVAALIGVSDET